MTQITLPVLLLSIFIGSQTIASVEIKMFKMINEPYTKELKSSIIEVTQIPAVGSQDGLDNCSAELAAVLIQHNYCKKKQIKNCNELGPDFRPSSLELYGMAAKLNLKESNGNSNSSLLTMNSGESILNVLNVASSSPRVLPESCFPKDQILSMSKNSQNLFTEVFEEMSKMFERQRQTKTEADFCFECEVEQLIKDKLNLSISRNDIKAFASASYKKFAWDLFLNNCKKSFKSPEFIVKYWPYGESEQFKNSDEIFEKIKNLLSSNIMVAMNLCLVELKPGEICPKNKDNQTFGHGVAIAGYKEVCNVNIPNDCKRSFRVLNSWGEDWQKENANGWIDADILYKHAIKVPGAITWIN